MLYESLGQAIQEKLKQETQARLDIISRNLDLGVVILDQTDCPRQDVSDLTGYKMLICQTLPENQSCINCAKSLKNKFLCKDHQEKRAKTYIVDTPVVIMQAFYP